MPTASAAVRKGNSLLSAVAGATTRVSLVELGAKGKTAVYLKLMDGPRLLDAVALPH
jgi:hypothetical protein